MPVTTNPYPMNNEGTSGFQLKFDVTGGSTFVAIKGIESIGDTEASVAEIETTKLLDGHKTWRASRQPDEGSVDVTIQYDPNDTGHTGLSTGFEAGTVMNWDSIYNDGAVTTPAHEICSGFISKWKINAKEKDSNTTATFTIRFTGADVRTVGV